MNVMNINKGCMPFACLGILQTLLIAVWIPHLIHLNPPQDLTLQLILLLAAIPSGVLLGIVELKALEKYLDRKNNRLNKD